jgi:hypothetical protein
VPDANSDPEKQASATRKVCCELIFSMILSICVFGINPEISSLPASTGTQYPSLNNLSKYPCPEK